MAIAQGYKTNFAELIRAIKNDQAVLMECNDASTGQPVIVIAAISIECDEYVTVPFAKMFDGNPYEELLPPKLPGEEPAI
jgi:hypothetical protein